MAALCINVLTRITLHVWRMWKVTFLRANATLVFLRHFGVGCDICKTYVWNTAKQLIFRLFVCLMGLETKNWCYPKSLHKFHSHISPFSYFYYSAVHLALCVVDVSSKLTAIWRIINALYLTPETVHKLLTLLDPLWSRFRFDNLSTSLCLSSTQE